MIELTSNVSEPPRVRVLRSRDPRPRLPLVEEHGTAEAIVWPGIGTILRSLHRFLLNADGRTVLQRHDSEAVYHVTSGAPIIEDVDTGARTTLRPGSMIHIGPGTGYRFHSPDGPVEIIGGPCPADPALYDSIEWESREG